MRACNNMNSGYNDRQLLGSWRWLAKAVGCSATEHSAARIQLCLQSGPRPGGVFSAAECNAAAPNVDLGADGGEQVKAKDDVIG